MWSLRIYLAGIAFGDKTWQSLGAKGMHRGTPGKPAGHATSPRPGRAAQ